MIDAHLHLWDKQHGMVDGLPVYDLGGGRSQFGSVVRQMTPAYINDGVNSVERLLANMDFAQVAGGRGDPGVYRRATRMPTCGRYARRIPCGCGSAPCMRKSPWGIFPGRTGIKMLRRQAGGSGPDPPCGSVPARRGGGTNSLAWTLADGDTQTASLREMIQQYPNVRMAIGHFGMVTTPGLAGTDPPGPIPQCVCGKRRHYLAVQQRVLSPYPSAVRAILEARDICGMEKLMWGSDYPPHHDGHYLPHELGLCGQVPLADPGGKAAVFPP